jgi:hypothetical protein
MNTQSVDIKYDYYTIECLNLQNTASTETITCSFSGKSNQPNLMCYNDDDTEINYNATDLFVYGNLHDLSNVDGEIVILHSATTSAIKLYCCFPFAYKTSEQRNELDVIFSSKTTESIVYQNPPVFLCLNNFIPVNPKVRKYQTIDKYGERCVVVMFENVISINSKLGNLNNNLFINNNSKTTQNASISVEDKLRSPSLIEGMSDSEAVYTCEYLPVDTEDMIQVLQVPLGSSWYNNLVGESVSNLFVSNAIFMFVTLFIFTMSPLLYNFIRHQLRNEKLKPIWLDRRNIFNVISVNLLNMVIILSISVLTIILLLVGFLKPNYTAATIGIFLPFSGFVAFFGIKYFYIFRRKLNDTNSEPTSPI